MSEMPGMKFDGQKVRLDLIHPSFILKLGEVLTYGARKYAPDNWKKVKHGRRRYIAAIERHLLSYRLGELLDSETKLPHLLHAACCVMFLYGYDILNVQDEPEPCEDLKCDMCYPPKLPEVAA